MAWISWSKGPRSPRRSAPRMPSWWSAVARSGGRASRPRTRDPGPRRSAARATPRPKSAATADRAASLSVEASEFDGGQVGVLASGPLEVSLRDCTFGPASAEQATIWAENLDAGAGSADFRIGHVSVLAGAGPVFRLAGTAPRVRVADSVFAPPTLAATAPTLIAIDSPERLDWRGVDNLYGRFGAYLQPPRGSSSRPAIRTFEGWADDPTAFRESGSVAIEGHPWQERNPLAAPSFRALHARSSLPARGPSSGPAPLGGEARPVRPAPRRRSTWPHLLRIIRTRSPRSSRPRRPSGASGRLASRAALAKWRPGRRTLRQAKGGDRSPLTRRWR